MHVLADMLSESHVEDPGQTPTEADTFQVSCKYNLQERIKRALGKSLIPTVPQSIKFWKAIPAKGEKWDLHFISWAYLLIRITPVSKTFWGDIP